jgi:hypothetical protein
MPIVSIMHEARVIVRPRAAVISSGNSMQIRNVQCNLGEHDDIFFPRLAPLDLTSPDYYEPAMTEEGLILTSTILTYISLHVRTVLKFNSTMASP